MLIQGFENNTFKEVYKLEHSVLAISIIIINLGSKNCNFNQMLLSIQGHIKEKLNIEQLKIINLKKKKERKKFGLKPK